MHEMIKVESSAISQIGYDSESRILYVKFNTGAIYRYFDIPPSLHSSLMKAGSIGSFFDREIRKKNYRFEVVRRA